MFVDHAIPSALFIFREEAKNVSCSAVFKRWVMTAISCSLLNLATTVQAQVFTSLRPFLRYFLLAQSYWFACSLA